MEAEEALRRLGGVAPASELAAAVGRRRLRTALTAGTVRRAIRGRIVLPGVTRQRLVAARLHGTLSHLSAAQHPRVAGAAPAGRDLGDRAAQPQIARTVQREVHALWAAHDARLRAPAPVR